MALVSPSPADRALVPWSRTWMALAVLAVVLGALYAALPHPRGTDVVAGEVVHVDCASPVLGAWRGERTPDPDDLADGDVDLRCPSSARERLGIGLVLAGAGAAGVVSLRRAGRGRPGRGRPDAPDAPSSSSPAGSDDTSNAAPSVRPNAASSPWGTSSAQR